MYNNNYHNLGSDNNQKIKYLNDTNYSNYLIYDFQHLLILAIHFETKYVLS